MGTLKEQMAAYETFRRDLEMEHLGEWVVVHDQQLIGTYKSFQTAADEAVQRFGRGPYLIRKVGARPFSLPASLLYRPVNADG